MLSLLEIVELFIEFRRDVVRRRTEFELRKAEARAHILEGLKIALDHLDAVITLIRGSKNPVEAAAGLDRQLRPHARFRRRRFSTCSSSASPGLERQKILDELAELRETIDRLRAILSSDRAAHRHRRRGAEGDLARSTATSAGRKSPRRPPANSASRTSSPTRTSSITATSTGYIKRTALDEYRSQRRGGKGLIGMTTREEDIVEHLFVANTHAYLLIFTDLGRCYWLRAYDVPEVGRSSKGKSIANLVDDGRRRAHGAAAARAGVPGGGRPALHRDGHRKGTIKKTDLWRSRNPRSAGIIAIGIDDDDAADRRRMTRTERRDLILGSRNGMAISVPGNRRPADGPHGAAASGALQLRDGDEVVAMERAWRAAARCSSVCERGYGKRTEIDGIPACSHAAASASSTSRRSDRNGQVVGWRRCRTMRS